VQSFSTTLAGKAALRPPVLITGENKRSLLKDERRNDGVKRIHAGRRVQRIAVDSDDAAELHVMLA